MQNQIEVKLNGNKILVKSDHLVLYRDNKIKTIPIDVLTNPQKVWLDNINACGESLINTL